MYLEFVQALGEYIEALNVATNKIQEEDGTPYVNFVPVILDGVLCGFLVDEIGGAYSYEQASDEERAWWKQKPGR